MGSQPSVALSIIIPALDEASNIGRLLDELPPMPGGTELLIVDGGSRDGTLEAASSRRERLAARGLRIRLLRSPRGRALQMNAGAARARGAALLFLHADTRLPPEAARAVERALRPPRVVGGAFRHGFAEPGVALRLVSAASNARSRLRGTYYGDQAIFVRRAVFEALGGFRPLPIFEDADLCRRLRRHGAMVLVSAAVRTSGRRFRQGGALRTVVRMLRMKISYGAGRDAGAVVGDYWDDSRRGREVGEQP